MERIITTLNLKAQNLEEVCCGIRSFWEEYHNREKRKQLIEEIECELEQFNEALNELKEIKQRYT